MEGKAQAVINKEMRPSRRGLLLETMWVGRCGSGKGQTHVLLHLSPSHLGGFPQASCLDSPGQEDGPSSHTL